DNAVILDHTNRKNPLARAHFRLPKPPVFAQAFGRGLFVLGHASKRVPCAYDAIRSRQFTSWRFHPRIGPGGGENGRQLPKTQTCPASVTLSPTRRRSILNWRSG